MPNPTPKPTLTVSVLKLALEGVAEAVAEEVWGSIFELVIAIMPDAIEVDDLEEDDEVKLDELGA